MGRRDVLGVLGILVGVVAPLAPASAQSAGAVAPSPAGVVAPARAGAVAPAANRAAQVGPERVAIPEGDHPVRRQILKVISQEVDGTRPAAAKKALLRTLAIAPAIKKERRVQENVGPLGYSVDVSYASEEEFELGKTDDLRLASPKSPFSRWNGPRGRTGLFRRDGQLLATWFFLVPQDKKVTTAMLATKQKKAMATDVAPAKVPVPPKSIDGLQNAGAYGTKEAGK